jgi:hypothetical protein
MTEYDSDILVWSERPAGLLRRRAAGSRHRCLCEGTGLTLRRVRGALARVARPAGAPC